MNKVSLTIGNTPISIEGYGDKERPVIAIKGPGRIVGYSVRGDGCEISVLDEAELERRKNAASRKRTASAAEHSVPSMTPTREEQGRAELSRRRRKGLDTSIEELHLRGQAAGVLRQKGVLFIGDIIKKGPKILDLPHVKDKARDTVLKFMEQTPLEFDMDLKGWQRPK